MILFQADRTCCVCRERGRQLQIHHIDDGPTNYSPGNLAALCLDCHAQTQLIGGFGRKLDAQQILAFRADWTSRVSKRRDAADDLASARAAGLPIRVTETSDDKNPGQELLTENASLPELLMYISALPSVRLEAHSNAKPYWDSGVTASMMQGSYDVIDVLEQVLTRLASWYPNRQFGDVDARDFFNAMTASRFEWHRAHLEPDGVGTGGTIVGTMAGGLIMGDLERMVLEMVRSLTRDEKTFDLTGWLAKWQL